MNILEILKQKKREYIRKHSMVEPPLGSLLDIRERIDSESTGETISLKELFGEEFLNKGVVGVVDYEQDDDTCDKQ